MLGLVRVENNHETESHKQNWHQSVRLLRFAEHVPRKSAREEERCEKNEDSGSQGNAFIVFVLLASKRSAILLSEIFLL